MEQCTVNKNGRHELSAVIPEDSDHDMTLFCSHCGALRRVPVSGALTASLDDLDAGAIRLAVGDNTWKP